MHTQCVGGGRAVQTFNRGSCLISTFMRAMARYQSSMILLLLSFVHICRQPGLSYLTSSRTGLISTSRSRVPKKHHDLQDCGLTGGRAEKSHRDVCCATHLVDNQLQMLIDSQALIPGDAQMGGGAISGDKSHCKLPERMKTDLITDVASAPRHERGLLEAEHC